MNSPRRTAGERFADGARSLGVEVVVTRFPEGTRTAADAAAAVGCEIGQIVKSLVFVADGRPVLALTSGRHRVDVARLAHFLGAAEVRQATADEVRAATGYAIGGTPPFAHADGQVPSVIDETLLAYDVVWAAGGTPDTVFPIAPDHLMAVCEAARVDLVD